MCTIREKSICADLSDEEMRAVSQTMAHLSVKEAQVLFTEGDESKFLYVVISGCFRMVRVMDDGRRQIVGFVFPGDFLGMGDVSANTYSAEALEPSLVCRFSNAFLAQMSERHPNIKNRLIAKGHTELHKAQDHIMILGKQSAEERVQAFFHMLTRQFKSKELYLPMSRQDIADYLGLRLETLSRTLSKLKQAGKLLRVDGRVVEVAA